MHRFTFVFVFPVMMLSVLAQAYDDGDNVVGLESRNYHNNLIQNDLMNILARDDGFMLRGRTQQASSSSSSSSGNLFRRETEDETLLDTPLSKREIAREFELNNYIRSLEASGKDHYLNSLLDRRDQLVSEYQEYAGLKNREQEAIRACRFANCDG